MKKLPFLFILLISLFTISLLSSVSAVNEASITTCPEGIKCEDENYCVYFFYGETCPHCAAVHPFVKQMAEKYKNFTFHELEIYRNQTNYNLFQDFMARYQIQKPGVPALFIGEKALIGSDAIEKNLEQTIQYYLENEPTCPLKYNKKEATSHDISPTQITKLTIPAVIGAAVIDSINPCAFAVLAFLTGFLLLVATKKRMLKIGFVYIFSVFIVYFLSGLGLFTIVQTIGTTRAFFNIATYLVLIAGIINVVDFFREGRATLAIPQSKMPLIEKYIKKASIPAAIILGILVSLFELPCTGGVYLAILSLLADNFTRVSALPWLLLYNFIFVLPLIIILLAVYFGFSAEKADKIRLKKRKWLRLIMGLFMILLGVAMLLGVF